jgi:glycosyltransferase involved in cell wall biosynthesis
MSMLFNVTDAVGSASNHGITRTERKLAAALADHDDVVFVVMHRGVLWRVETSDVVARLRPQEDSGQPKVERFGVDRVPESGASSSARSILRRRHRNSSSRTAASSIGLTRLELASDQTLVSVGLDWVHGTLAEAERLVLGHGGRFVGFCYDMIPIDHPEWIYPAEPERFVRYYERMIRVASEVMCISHSTRRDFMRGFPSVDEARAPVIRLGADAAAAVGDRELAWVDEHLGDEPYAVYCATIDRRKNHALLARVAKQIARSDRPGRFVFVGMVGSGVSDLIDVMRHDRSTAGRIVHVTECDDAHLAAIYRRASFAVYPSLYEGWGLGVTEALAHGKSCIVAGGSSLGEAGLGVCPELHPLRTREWVERISQYFAEPPVLPAIDLPTWESAARDLIGRASS